MKSEKPKEVETTCLRVVIAVIVCAVELVIYYFFRTEVLGYAGWRETDLLLTVVGLGGTLYLTWMSILYGIDNLDL